LPKQTAEKIIIYQSVSKLRGFPELGQFARSGVKSPRKATSVDPLIGGYPQLTLIAAGIRKWARPWIALYLGAYQLET
jgi:hypothetical protein